jgi:hypothetical protein
MEAGGPSPQHLFMKQLFGIPTTALLAGLLGISSLIAASPSPTPFASQENIAPRVAPAKASDKAVVPADQEEAHSNPPKRSFLAPIEDFARDSILCPKAPFELVPGKDPNGWGFVLEPYGWAMALDGNVGVKGLPALSVDVSALDLLRHIDWFIFARGEIRKGPVGASRGRLLRRTVRVGRAGRRPLQIRKPHSPARSRLARSRLPHH